MLAAMSDMLRIKCEKMETAYEIMESLQAMFRQPSDQSRHDAFKAVMNTKMKSETLVREHQTEIHGMIINKLREKRKKRKSDLLFLEAYLIKDDSSPWIIDSKVINHVCSSLQMLSSSR